MPTRRANNLERRACYTWGAMYDCACRYAYAAESLSHLGSEVFSKWSCILWAYTLDVRNESTQAPAIAFLVRLGNQVRLQLVYARSRAIISLFRRTQCLVPEPRPCQCLRLSAAHDFDFLMGEPEATLLQHRDNILNHISGLISGKCQVVDPSRVCYAQFCASISDLFVY